MIMDVREEGTKVKINFFSYENKITRCKTIKFSQFFVIIILCNFDLALKSTNELKKRFIYL